MKGARFFAGFDGIVPTSFAQVNARFLLLEYAENPEERQKYEKALYQKSVRRNDTERVV